MKAEELFGTVENNAASKLRAVVRVVLRALSQGHGGSWTTPLFQTNGNFGFQLLAPVPVMAGFARRDLRSKREVDGHA